MKLFNVCLTIAAFLTLQACGGSNGTTSSQPQYQVSTADVGTYSSNGTTLTINSDSSMTYTATTDQNGSECTVTETGIITGESVSGNYTTYSYRVNSAALASTTGTGHGSRGNGNNNNSFGNSNRSNNNNNNSNCTNYVNELNSAAANSQWITGTVSSQGLRKQRTHSNSNSF